LLLRVLDAMKSSSTVITSSDAGDANLKTRIEQLLSATAEPHHVAQSEQPRVSLTYVRMPHVAALALEPVTGVDLDISVGTPTVQPVALPLDGQAHGLGLALLCPVTMTFHPEHLLLGEAGRLLEAVCQELERS
jgi:hypothetical protein